MRARHPDAPESIAEFTFLCGVEHSIDDRPAYRHFVEATGREICLIWYKNGLEHRDGKPSYLLFNDNGSVRARHWCIDGAGHRLDGPSREIISETTGRPIELEYRQFGRWFRLDGPASMNIAEDTGIVTCEKWCSDPEIDGWHREDGPAVTFRDRITGIAYEQIWMRKNALFRPDRKAPVVFRDRITGEITGEDWSHRFLGQSPSVGLPSDLIMR